MRNENRLSRAAALAIGFSVVASAAWSITGQEMTFENAGVTLSGTLTLPDGPYPQHVLSVRGGASLACC